MKGLQRAYPRGLNTTPPTARQPQPPPERIDRTLEFADARALDEIACVRISLLMFVSFLRAVCL